MASIWVISDIHIDTARDPAYGKLLRWIEAIPDTSDTWLILGGDIFDLWISSQPVFTQEYAAFITLLENKGRSIHIAYIEGNHDFHLQDVFGRSSSVTVYESGLTLELGGKKILIEHGDLANSSDYGYRILRGFLRGSVFHQFSKLASSRLVAAIGNYARKTSAQTHPELPEAWPKSQLDRLRKIYRNYATEKFQAGHDIVVLGHCHDLDGLDLRIGERFCHYLNVGFPKRHRQFVYWDGSLEKPVRRDW